jgi:hypothetical protein
MLRLAGLGVLAPKDWKNRLPSQTHGPGELLVLPAPADVLKEKQGAATK